MSPGAPAPAQGPSTRLPPLAVLAGFLALALLAYAPALRAGWVWDDDSYVTENPLLDGVLGLRRIWSEPRASPQYYPLVFTGFWLERALFGEGPAAHHVANVLLHACGAFLLWRLLLRLRVAGALLGALLFLLHPVCVESVAWITERKNVLALCFALGAALAWLRARPVDGEPPPARAAAVGWLLSLGLFACALLSKTTTAFLPVGLAILGWWKRGRLRRDELALLVPHLLLAVALGMQTALLEREHVGATGLEWSLGPLERTVLAGSVFWSYLAKLAWPHPLAFFYRRWEVDAADPLQLAAALAVVALFAGLLLARRRLGRGPLVVFLLFGLGIGPASGFFDVYPMRYSWVADHFQYLALLAPLAGAGWLWARLPWPPAARGALAVLVLGALGALTWRRSHAFEDAETLWRDTLAKTPSSWAAHAQLGHLALAEGREEQGRALLEEAARLSPYPSEAWGDVATLRLRDGDVTGALELLVPLMRARPAVAERTGPAAAELLAAGRAQDAEELLEAALAAAPDALAPRLALAGLVARRGELARARRLFEQATALDPQSADAALGLAGCAAAEGRRGEALSHARRALALRPGWPEAARLLERLSAER